ncbi:MAG: ABC transporter ATP-binding protein [Bacteroidota bacterium]|nr:ABC transporter ATP-binding protein [Bacteroidota bacterium]
MSDTVIKVENISKQYRLGNVGLGTIGADINRWYQTSLRGREDPYLKIGEENDRSVKGDSDYVWALRDINFEVKQGEVLGIIGRNGAGKSTLLKILSRTTTPTTGQIKIKGRVASLLEVGTGFHPELTGRENIFLNGAILGMTKKEVKSKLDEIVDFSGVERYIDTPVKRYSSGMYVRLAFAVAASLDPEILIVDEVLAVGDAEFQKKAIGKMQDVSGKEGRTVLVVSHNMGSIAQLCSKAIFLKNGIIDSSGDVDHIVNYYLKSCFSNSTEISFPVDMKPKGNFTFVRLVNELGEPSDTFAVGQDPTLEIHYILHQAVTDFHVAIIVNDTKGNHLYSSADTDLNESLLQMRSPGVYRVKVQVPTQFFNAGTFNISAGMGIINREIFHREDLFNFTIADVGDFGTGKEGGRRQGLLLVTNNKWEYID